MEKMPNKDVLPNQPYFLPKCRSLAEVFSSVKWKRVDAVIKSGNGELIFALNDVEAPESWSQTACEIAASKYFRHGEKSIRRLVERVVTTIGQAGQDQGYFLNKALRTSFEVDLAYLLIHQRASFNSPVWFNLGLFEFYKSKSQTSNYAWDFKKETVAEYQNSLQRPQVSACFIQGVEDSVESLYNLAKTEAQLFKFGSGSGTNFSKVRSRFDKIDTGGTSSGLLAFLDMLDRGAAAIKSGGTTRRAAKMVCLDVSHPEILEFINWKSREEEKAKALVKAGYSDGIDGEAYRTVSGQNSNNSIRVSRKFFTALAINANWDLKSPRTGRKVTSLPAREIWRAMAKAAHQTGDPGLQFSDTITAWHTCKVAGPILASNPCSEFMFLDDSACNLASLNLLKFLQAGQFNWLDYSRAIRVMILAQDILIDRAGYPTPALAKNSHDYRPLGLGFCGLGAFFMRQGLAYDSEDTRKLASELTDFLTATAYQTSLVLAVQMGAFKGWSRNKKSMLAVLKKHQRVATKRSKQIWAEVLRLSPKVGMRNSQVSLMAPTGTIGLVMDSETTGIEPEFALVKVKSLSGGGEIKTISSSLSHGLTALGYRREQIQDIENFVKTKGGLAGAPEIKKTDLQVFATAHGGTTDLTLRAEAHLQMMAAIQNHISGAISKTVNLPNAATIEDIESIYLHAYKLGLKSVAIYRDGSKGAQPLSKIQNCAACGSSTRLVGGCYLCDNCGTTTGCVN